jgi:hypothetical protein
MRAKTPKISQTRVELIKAPNITENSIVTLSNLFNLFEREKNSSAKSDIIPKSPAKNPREVHEPKRLLVLFPSSPKDVELGIKICKTWNINNIRKEYNNPIKTFLAFLGSFNTTEDTSIKRNAANINQKVPISNIIPKRDIWDELEKIAEIRNANTTKRPDSKSLDLGKVIFPSEKRAAVQKMIETARPMMSNNPLLVSIGIFEKGRKNKGKSTITKKSDQKEILSRTFDIIIFYLT